MQTIAQRLGKLAADITLGGAGGKLPQANKALGSGMSSAKAMPISPTIKPPAIPPRPTGGSVTNPLAAPPGAMTQALPPPPARSLAQNFEDERAAAANSPQARYMNRNAYKPQQPFSSNPFAAPPPQAPPPPQSLSHKANFLVN